MVMRIPIVCSGILYYKCGEQMCRIRVGTPTWYDWLKTATIFLFKSRKGTFRVCKERSGSNNTWIWYAYLVKHGGSVRHAYLGKSQRLTLERMQIIAEQIATEEVVLEPSEKTVFTECLASTQSKEVVFLGADTQRREIHHLRLIQSTGLIGREREVAAAAALLQSPDVRLLVITGPGGVGKTSLALQVALTTEDSFSDGVCYVSLAPIKDADLVITSILQELGLVEIGEESSVARIDAYLRNKRLLLFLDNFEQVIDTVPLLLHLLSSCRGIKILVTSREILHLRIEHTFVVPPLAVPDLKQPLGVDQLAHYAAVSLFVQRSLAINPEFQLTPANAHIIAEICVRLDGLPLAIELAVARSRLLSPSALLERLERRLQILISGPQDLPRRQQSLRDTLAWSYDLLKTDEQFIFRMLSVFVRGCTLGALEEMYKAIYNVHVDVLETISSLIDKSLLQQIEQVTGDVRILMLETVREYGQECLALCGETENTCKAHAQYYLNLAEKAEPEIRRAEQVKWLNQLEQEHDNLRASLHWFLEQGEIEAALRLCAALYRFWLISSHQSEGYQWVEKALAASEKIEVPLEIRAKVLSVAGILAHNRGQHQRSSELLHRSLSLYREVPDHWGMAAVLTTLGNSYARLAPAKAHQLYQESLALSLEHNNVLTTIDVLISLADEATSFTDFARARTLFETSLALAKREGDKRSLAYCLGGLGQITIREGNYASAYALLKESLELYREIKDHIGIAFTLIPLGMATLYQGDYHASQTLLEESAHASKKLGEESKITHYLASVGEVALLSQKGENLPVRAMLEESLAIFKGVDNEEGIAFKLFALGCMESVQGTLAAAIHLLEEGVALFHRLGNRAMEAASLGMLGHVYAHRGEYTNARVFMERSLEISREIGDHWTTSYGLSHLGLVALNEGDYTTAYAFMEQSVGLAREMEDHRYIAEALSVMGLLRMKEGDYVSAQALLEEGLGLSKEVGDHYFIAYRLADLGLLAILKKNYVEARSLVEESLRLSLQMDNRWFLASCLERLGQVVLAQHQPRWATQLWGTAAAIRTAIGAPIPPIERALYEDAVTTARTQLGEELFVKMWKAGSVLSPKQALAAQPSSEPAQKKETLPTGTGRDIFSPLRATE